MDEADRAHQRALKAGRSDSGRTQILSGDLKPGERVITAGQYKVQDGSHVATPQAPHTAQAEQPDASGRQTEARR